MPKLTKTVVEGLVPGAKDRITWDADLPGFGVRVKPSGRRSYLVQYRNRQQRSRRLTVGLHGRITADQARREARALLARVELGEDPAADRHSQRQANDLRELANRYLVEHAEVTKKPRSVVEDRRLLDRHILPIFGHRVPSEITREDVTALHRKIGAETPTTANRVLALLSKMFNLAEVWGLRPDASNPCRHISRFKEKRRERYLSSEELARLHQALEEAEAGSTEHPIAIAAIRLLLFTGCRVSEILGLRWDEVDLERGCCRLRDSKTGRKTIYLNEPALEVVRALGPAGESPYVLPGRRADSHFINLKDPWGRIRRRAQLADVRLHDLRHTFASVGIAAGLSLPQIGKLLGHASTATTERYAHLAVDPQREAAALVGRSLGRRPQSTTA